MIHTRCKFRVEKVTKHNWLVSGSNVPKVFGETVELAAVYGDEDPENQSFSSATPQGKLEFTVTNPNVIGTFEPGACFYLDLVPMTPKS